jgi:hypothetical protein
MGLIWEQEVAGSNPAIPTPHPDQVRALWILIQDGVGVSCFCYWFFPKVIPGDQVVESRRCLSWSR